jgi:2-polyprenyl-3-methyl-5-hydroxy-6-metoxy-1,4-benzoquinol methylase
MSFDVVGGALEDGLVVGNSYDKYGSKNPIVRWMMKGFDESLAHLVAAAAPRSIHEVGCGEGYWTLRWLEACIEARGCDVSHTAVDLARRNATARGVDPTRFETRSIYDLEAGRDSADLVVCCEVLEHLDDPEGGLRALRRIVGNRLILSVPREPIWCALNLARGKYIAQGGNTPGHLQHWSRRGFIRLVARHFHIDQVLSPLPWTMLSCRPHE